MKPGANRPAMRLLILLVAVAWLAGCGGGNDLATSPVTGNFPTPVVLGAVYSQTGALAPLDVPSALGAQLAVSQANRQGQTVVLRLADAQSDPTAAAAATQSLLPANPVAFLGLSDTNEVAAAAPVATAAGRAFLTSGATSPLLPSQVSGLTLACFGDNVQAAAGAEYAFNTLGARTASIVYDSSQAYPKLLETYFQARWEQLGARTVSKASYASTDQIGAAMGQIQTGVDLVYLAAETSSDALTGVAALRQAGYSKPVMGGDGYDSSDLGPSHPEVSQVFFTTHADVTSSDPTMTAFVSSYRQFTGQAPTAFSALGYDAVNLLLTAVRSASSASPAAVSAALGQVTQFQGVTGHFTYSAASPGVPVKTVTVVAVQAGQRSSTSLIPQQVPPASTPFKP